MMPSLFFDDRQTHFGDGCLSILNGSQEACTEGFFHWWLKSICQRVDAVVIIGFLKPVSFYQAFLDDARKCRGIIYDGYSDPLGWYKDIPSFVDQTCIPKVKERVVSFKDDLSSLVREACGKSSSIDAFTVMSPVTHCTFGPDNIISDSLDCPTVAVAIDSLTSVLRHQSIGTVCHTLNTLNYLKQPEVQLSQILCVVDMDTIPVESVEKLNYYASVIIQLQQPETDDNERKKPNAINIDCEVMVRKKSGKVQREEGSYQLTHDWKLQKVAHSGTKVLKADNESRNVDPTADIPFRLQLSESEKEARAQVTLPYTYNEQRKAEHLTRSVGEGKVFYQPDEVDDFDDEDPDDDLDI